MNSSRWDAVGFLARAEVNPGHGAWLPEQDAAGNDLVMAGASPSRTCVPEDPCRGIFHTPSICFAGQTLQMEKSTSSSFSRRGQ